MLEYRARAPDFGAFLERNVGKVGYLIGTRGQLCTQAMIDARLASTSYQSYWSNIRLYGSQWIGKVVADCMGIYDMFMNGGEWDRPLSTFKYADTSTYTMYALAVKEGLPNGDIATIPKDKPYPIAVHFTGHVGFYHKGFVYQSIGHRRGFIMTTLGEAVNGKTWAKWYYLPYLDYSGGEDVLQRGDKNDQVKAWQTSLLAAGYQMIGSTGTVYGADGSFGAATEGATKKFQADHGLTQTGIVTTAVFCAMLSTLEGLRVDLKSVYDAAKIKIAGLTLDLTNTSNQLLIATNKIESARNALS